MVHKRKEESAQEDSMGETSDYNQSNNLDEKLIKLVQDRPALYDCRVSPKERSKIMKQAMWFEISKCMKGQLKPEAAEVRWKYLRENYLKARKKQKVKEEIARRTGMPLRPSGKNRKYSFRYYEIMEFLNESLDYQKIMSLNNTLKTKEIAKSQNTQKSKLSTRIQKTSQSNLNSSPSAACLDNFEEVDDDLQVASPASPMSLETSEFECSSNIKGSDNNSYDQIFMECLQKPIQKPCPIDGFLVRLGEGLKRLPYRERSRLELEFLKRVHEVEEQLEIYD